MTRDEEKQMLREMMPDIIRNFAPSVLGKSAMQRIQSTTAKQSLARIRERFAECADKQALGYREDARLQELLAEMIRSGDFDADLHAALKPNSN
jgi:hypothetical protein